MLFTYFSGVRLAINIIALAMPTFNCLNISGLYFLLIGVSKIRLSWWACSCSSEQHSAHFFEQHMLSNIFCR
jgi:hypothetical protein